MIKTKTFIKRDIAGETMLIPSGKTAEEINGMITLQGIGGFIWDNIEKTKSLDELLDLITEAFDVDRKEAGGDALVFIMQMLQAGIIKPSGKDW